MLNIYINLFSLEKSNLKSLSIEHHSISPGFGNSRPSYNRKMKKIIKNCSIFALFFPFKSLLFIIVADQVHCWSHSSTSGRAWISWLETMEKYNQSILFYFLIWKLYQQTNKTTIENLQQNQLCNLLLLEFRSKCYGKVSQNRCTIKFMHQSCKTRSYLQIQCIMTERASYVRKRW